MKYKIVKIIIIFSIFLIFINILNVPCYAAGLKDVIDGGNGFINSKDPNVKINEFGTGGIKEISDGIYNILLSVAIVVDLVVGIIIGIKLMTSEAENKAEAKKSLVVFVIGSIVVYGAFGIWKIMVTFLNTI